jgi:geranylgeranyl pyrophosphate synthase
MLALAELVLSEAEQAAEAHPDWALLALPSSLCAAYDLPADRAEAVLAGAVLIYAAADVIDDAQDGDLAPAEWGDPPWHRGVNVGNALLFAAVAAFQAAAPGADMAEAVAQAGLRMASGQHLDFALGPQGAADSEAAYLECIEGKSGGSLGLFCRAAGLAAGRPSAHLDALEELGRCIGSAVQIRSDINEIWSAQPSRDLANGRRTLPILYARAMLDKPGRDRLAELVADPDRKHHLIALLESLGTAPYCDLRLQTYIARANAAVSGLDLPLAAAERLASLLEVLGQPTRQAAI